MASNGQPNDPQLLKSGSSRIWLQEGCGNPLVPSNYQGLIELQKTDWDIGKKEPVWIPSSSQRNRWDIADTIVRSPALATSGFMQHVNKFLADRWVSLANRSCDFNMRAINSSCARPDDPSQWDSQVLLWRTRLEKFGLPLLNPFDGSKNVIVDVDGTLSIQGLVFIVPMQFTQVATATAVAEIVDAFYYDAIQCGDCGPVSDGCQKVYALQIANAGSPGLSSQLLYASDGGYTWAAIDIPTLGGLSASRMAPMGLYCLVVSANQGAYHYALFSDIQAGTVNWTKITTGFVAGKSPRCITVRDPNTGWIGAQGGVIYSLSQVGAAVTVLTDGTLSAQDVNDIHFYGRTIVAVQNNNGVLYSLNNGQSWNVLTGPAVGQNLTAVWCQTPTTWLVGVNNGTLWVGQLLTPTGTITWTQLKNLPTAAATNIDDLQMFDENIGYLAVEVAGAAQVWRTVDAGNTWRYSPSSEIGALPGAPVRVDVVAPCGPNNCLAVGRKTVGGAGYIALARNAQ